MTFPKSRARTAARLALGGVFFIFGLNGFLSFIPQPPHAGPAADFLGALAATGYMFPLVKGVELVTGLLLLAGRYVPLALTLLAPVVVNIVAFHLFLEPASLALPVVLLALGSYLAWTERASFAPLFKARSGASAKLGDRAGGHASAAA
jgi:hypothetical protein